MNLTQNDLIIIKKHFDVKKCDMIKQNESKVSNNMLLLWMVADYSYTSNIGQQNLKLDTCEHVYVTSIEYLGQVPGINIDIYITFK